jgi:hypothetical protein
VRTEKVSKHHRWLQKYIQKTLHRKLLAAEAALSWFGLAITDTPALPGNCRLGEQAAKITEALVFRAVALLLGLVSFSMWIVLFGPSKHPMARLIHRDEQFAKAMPGSQRRLRDKHAIAAA